ncbi:MAG: hypothetical protein OXN17_13935 [Candidatus Poribacteria bacterium]|nr:hypothetical protein [Candidatus Poribacteria bacterium]
MIKSCCDRTSRRRPKSFHFCILVLLAANLANIEYIAFAQNDEGEMRVSERDDTGRAIQFDFNFISRDLRDLIRFLSQETDLTFVASENEIKDKKFALTNLKNVSMDEMLEEVKTVLSTYNLTTIRDGNTVLITTFEKAVQMKVPVKRITADASQVETIDEIQTYIIQLENAAASELVGGLKPLLNKAANIFADANSNSLVITDVASNVRRIATILQVADEAPEMPLKIEIVPLQNATASSLAATLNEVFQDETQIANVLRTMGSTKDPEKMEKMMDKAKEEGAGIDMLRGRIYIAADDSSNSLVIKASESNLVALKDVIRQLDTAPNIQTEIKIFRLNLAIAQDVAQTLEEVITGQSAGRRPGSRAQWWERREWDRRRREVQRDRRDRAFQGIIGTVHITANDRLNAVIVSTDPRNLSLIEKLIKELDQADPQEEVRIFFLKFADAQTLSDNLVDLFEGGTAGRDRNRPWWERREGRRTQESSGFGVQGTVHLVPDSRLNALLVTTASQNFQTIENLVKRLDVSMPSQEWGTRVYPLKYADAENVANIINSVYQGANNNSGFFFFLPQRNRNEGSLAGNVSAEPYITLNAVVVTTATQRNFELITEFIRELDVPTPEGQTEVTMLVRLEYASAEQTAEILESIWGEGEDGGRGFSFRRFFAAGGRLEQKDINSLRGQVEIAADIQTNSLLVRTAKRYIPQVQAMIEQLDFVRGQVWIDIQILEVTLDESTKLGLELTAQENKLFGRQLRSGNPLVGSVDTQLGLDQEISGFTYRIATKEYMGLLHTLMRENKVKTLSTPSLLTRDNQQATWSRGRTIPYLQSVDTTSLLGEGVNQPLFNYDFITPPVGINITLTPHIARSREGSDGKRTIGLDIEQIQASNFIEFTDFNAPITEDSSISAYIDVEDGQQIVVGGMIKSKQQEIESKVPILGDIPFIGRLFKRTEKVTENSEIVIIITPHIVDIKNPEDLEKLQKEAEKWRSNNGQEEASQEQ